MITNTTHINTPFCKCTDCLKLKQTNNLEVTMKDIEIDLANIDKSLRIIAQNLNTIDNNAIHNINNNLKIIAQAINKK